MPESTSEFLSAVCRRVIERDSDVGGSVDDSGEFFQDDVEHVFEERDALASDVGHVVE